jgi:hypothetical protein
MRDLLFAQNCFEEQFPICDGDSLSIDDYFRSCLSRVGSDQTRCPLQEMMNTLAVGAAASRAPIVAIIRVAAAL